MTDIIPTIFYDEQSFPQAQIYAEVWSIYAVNMNIMLMYNELKPTRNDYGKIYFACKDREKFKDIINNFSRFGYEYVDFLPDYRGCEVVAKAIELYNKNLLEPFSDIAPCKAELQYKEDVINKEKQGIFLDPKPDEPLNSAIRFNVKRRRNG